MNLDEPIVGIHEGLAFKFIDPSGVYYCQLLARNGRIHLNDSTGFCISMWAKDIALPA